MQNYDIAQKAINAQVAVADLKQALIREGLPKVTANAMESEIVKNINAARQELHS